jgi:hypothetical protein
VHVVGGFLGVSLVLRQSFPEFNIPKSPDRFSAESLSKNAIEASIEKFTFTGNITTI